MLIPRRLNGLTTIAVLLTTSLALTLPTGCGGGGSGSGKALTATPKTPGSSGGTTVPSGGTGTTPGGGTGTTPSGGTGTTPGGGTGTTPGGGTGTTPGGGTGTTPGGGTGTTPGGGANPSPVAVITSLSPNSGLPGSVVLVRGLTFGSSPAVSVSGLPALLLASTNTTASFAVPTDVPAGSHDIRVTGPGGTSTPLRFVVRATTPGTILVRIDPPGGVANQIVVLRGTGFGTTPPPSVRFGGTIARLVDFSETSVTVRVPASLGAGAVSVMLTPAGASLPANAFAFTVTAPITSSRESFSALASLSTPRSAHSATVLRDGRVLIVGGDSTGKLDTLATAGIFDPRTRTVTPLASRMSVSRMAHSATLLPDGRVLIAGGLAGPTTSVVAHASTDIFDPATNSFSPGPNLLEPRDAHVAVELANGDVLLTGGEGPNPVFGQFMPLRTCEIYRFQLRGPGSIVAAPINNFGRLQTAALPSAGGAIVVGGLDAGGELASAEVFDQAQNIWSVGTASSGRFIMTLPRSLPLLLRLANGDLAAIGGYSPTGLATLLGADPLTTMDIMPTEPSNPNVGIFSIRSFPALPPRVGGAGLVLADDRVLLVGSAATAASAASASIFDAAMTTGRLTLDTPATPRFDLTASLLFDGRVLITGGGGDASQVPNVFGPALPITNSVELFTP